MFKSIYTKQNKNTNVTAKKQLSDINASIDNPAEKMVTITVFGKKMLATSDRNLAGFLLEHNIEYTRTTPVSQQPRKPYCMMGTCFECLMVINDKPSAQACLTVIKDGMTVEKQQVFPETKILENLVKKDTNHNE